MRKQMWTFSAVVGLSLALLVLAFTIDAGAADDPVPKDIKDEVNKMADAIGKGEKVDKQADKFFNDHPKDFKKTMKIFKLRADGGFGVGKPGTFDPDGIDSLMKNQNNTTRKPKMVLNLKASADDLTRMTDVILAMTEITAKFQPTKKVGDKDPAVWKMATDDMRKSTLDLKSAIKDGDNAKFKQAYLKLEKSCNDCHSKFRDNDD